VLSAALQGLALLIAALFLLAALHKVRMLRAGRALFDPLISVSAWRRRNATLALALAASAELLVAASLVCYPPVGFCATCLIVAVYTGALRRLPADEPCNCFGEALRSHDRSTAIQRNLVLIAVSLAAFAGYLGADVDVSALSPTSAGLALVLGSILGAAEAVRRLPAADHVD
jgi:hypothetical protein